MHIITMIDSKLIMIIYLDINTALLYITNNGNKLLFFFFLEIFLLDKYEDLQYAQDLIY